MADLPSSPLRSLVQLRNLAPILLGLGLLAAGLWALFHLLRSVEPQLVMAQIKAMPWSALIASGAATVAAYLALVGYDWWALAYLGKPLPVRIVVLGGFLGYAFGNTIGISVLSGGAVRYRIYSAFGLNAFDVAALASYIAVAMGTGLTLIGLLALGFHPLALASLLPLPPHMIQFWAFAIAGLTLLLLFALSIGGKKLRIWRYDLALPRPRILIGQLLIALIDSAMAAAALYVLMPDGVPPFAAFMAIYAAAAMVGILSHVPGGVGVFEGVVIAAMPFSVPISEVAAALLLFRLIYFLLPFALAFVVVSLNEARLAGGWATRAFGEISTPMRPVMVALGGAVPALVGLWVLVLGTYLLAMALLPAGRTDSDAPDLVRLILLEGGTLVSAVMGILLIVLSRGLIRRVYDAFWLTLLAIGGGIIAALANDFDIDTAVVLLLGGVALWPFRAEFHRRASITQGSFSPTWFALIAAVLLGGTGFFALLHEVTPSSQSLLLEFSHDANTPRALRAGLLGSALLLAIALHVLLRPLRSPAVTLVDEAARLTQILAQTDMPNACLALSGDKDLFFAADAPAMLMYARQGSKRVVLGDPVGSGAAVKDLAWRFVEETQRAGERPVFYEVSATHLPLWIDMGLVMHKIGEEAVVHLPAFSLSGSNFKTMRAEFNKAEREGNRMEILHPPHSETLMAQLRSISDAWLGDKVGREKRFSVGRFDPAYLAHFPIAVVRRAGEILGFANILAPGAGQHVAIDLMRYRPEAASGMMSFLFLSLIVHYRDIGAQTLSLGVAPLAGLGDHRGARLWGKFGHLIYRHGGAFDNFEGLRAFKQKFHPEWQPRYIALPFGLSPVVVMGEIALLIAGGKRGMVGKKSPPDNPPPPC